MRKQMGPKARTRMLSTTLSDALAASLGDPDTECPCPCDKAHPAAKVCLIAAHVDTADDDSEDDAAPQAVPVCGPCRNAARGERFVAQLRRSGRHAVYGVALCWSVAAFMIAQTLLGTEVTGLQVAKAALYVAMGPAVAVVWYLLWRSGPTSTAHRAKDDGA